MHRVGEQRVAAPDHPVATAHAMPRPHDARRAPTASAVVATPRRGTRRTPDSWRSLPVGASVSAVRPQVTSRTTSQAAARTLDRGARVHHDVEPGGPARARPLPRRRPRAAARPRGHRPRWPGRRRRRTASCSRRRPPRRPARPRRRASARRRRRARSAPAGARARSRARCDCTYAATPYAAREVLVDRPTTAHRPGVVRSRVMTSGSLRCDHLRTVAPPHRVLQPKACRRREPSPRPHRIDAARTRR